jgi:glycosyltransferase involved in cell wall biosynthesis
MTEPLVSVICITYNHENFISNCLDGFLMQETDFSFEILIHDDASTDKTASIIKSYEKKYPGKIYAIYQNENQFSKGINPGTLLYPRAKGKYIATCEGDDYWTDPLKLQKQVDFLEANAEYSFCFHDTIILKQETGEKGKRIGSRKIDESVDLKSVIIENNFPTASLVFRNIIDWKNIPEWVMKTAKGDYALVVRLSEKGLGKYLSEPMSVYRVHSGGVWSGRQDNEYYTDQDVNFYESLFENFNDSEVRKAIRFKLNKSYQNKGIYQLRKGKLISGIFNILTHWNFTNDRRLKTPVRKILGAVKTGLTK